MNDSPATIRDHIAVLTEFEHEYRQYVHALEQEVQTGRPYWHPQAQAQHRADLIRRAPRAGRAIRASGVTLTLTPPPLLRGPVLTDFVSQIMAHETPTYGGGPDPLTAPHMVLDNIVAALGALDDQLVDAEAANDDSAPREPDRPTPRWPTLVGRIRHVPRAIGIIADIGGAAAVIAFAGRVLGLW